jgi:L-threonylcarbamoyladenylate synthase
MKEIDLTAGSDEGLEELLTPASLAIKDGGLVVLPTMTYYALGADALNPDAVKRVFSAKKRDRSKPLIVLVDSFEMMKPLVRDIPAALKELEWKLGTGGLSYVLPATDGVPSEVTAETGTVAVRIDRNEVIQCVLASVGQPITGPSANIEGSPPARTCDDAVAQLRDWIDVAVRWWPAAVAAPSTIVDLTSDTPRVIREGTVAESDVLDVLSR